MLLDRQRDIAEIDLLDHSGRDGQGGPQIMAAAGAGIEAMIEGAAVDGLGRERGPLVLGMAGLAADSAFVLALWQRRPGRLDDVRRRWLGRGRGILVSHGELLAELGDEFGLQGIDSRLKPSAVVAGDSVLGSLDALFYMPRNKGTTPVR
jgi:hypothetical protein